MGPHAHNAHMTGIDLKLRRVAADVKAKEIASLMGVSQSRVSRIENSRVISEDVRDRYLTALDTCSTKSTSAQAVA